MLGVGIYRLFKKKIVILLVSVQLFYIFASILILHYSLQRKKMRITLIKKNRHKDVINRLDIAEAVRMMATGEQLDEVHRIRSMYHLMRCIRKEDGQIETNFEGGIQLPRLCFAVEYEHRKGERVRLKYNGLVVLEVNNLIDYDEAIAVRERARRIPHTLLAFLGASGRSVKIVCRGELYPDLQQAQAGKEALPVSTDEIVLFHRNLYETARKAYGGQLDMSIEAMEPRLDRTVYMSVDPDLEWNTNAVPFYADCEEKTVDKGNDGASGSSLRSDDPEMSNVLLPGRSQNQTYHLNFMFIIETVLGHYFELPDENRLPELLMRVASHCLEEGIPLGIAQSMTLLHPLFQKDELLVRKTFSAVYTVDILRKYQEKHKFRPLKSIPEDTLLMMKTEMFLNANYDMRKNVMTGVAQYRQKDGFSREFHDLDQEARNDMTIRAKEMGLKSWDRDIDRFIDSTRIVKYDPVNDWLDRLPRWDGKDRVAGLAARVPNNQPSWEHHFRTWLLGMVAHWMGRSTLTGNALVPLLIGRQGCGKSSFCRILLPHELRDYYNDRISFKNETDLNLGLTSFALINIDEFDKTTQRQQVLLKYLLSTADVKFRPPYGKAVKQYRRYASFIGTTNQPKPLVDPTGSRRFLCVEVTGDIDFSDTLNHKQLYAQLRQQVNDGQRYWLDDQETLTLMEANDRFLRVNGLEEMIAETFRKPTTAAEGRWWMVGEISKLLLHRYRSADTRTLTLSKIGQTLNLPRFGFDSKRRKQGMVYLLVER